MLFLFLRGNREATGTIVESVMPERTEEYIYGRYLYMIPEQELWRAEYLVKENLS